MLSISTKNKAGLLLIQRELYRKYRFVFFFFHDWNSPPLVAGSLFVVYKWWHRGSDVTTSRPSSQLHNWVWQALIHTTHTPQPFYSPFSGTTRVSRCQKRTLWCKGDRCRYTDHTATIRLGATPSRLTSAHLHNLPFFNMPDAMPFLLPNQQCQSIEGNSKSTTTNTDNNNSKPTTTNTVTVIVYTIKLPSVMLCVAYNWTETWWQPWVASTVGVSRWLQQSSSYYYITAINAVWRPFLRIQLIDQELPRSSAANGWVSLNLSLIHIWRCRRSYACRSRWSPYH